MSTTLSTYEPTQIRAGDTFAFTKSLSDYLASEGWLLQYKLVGSAGCSDDVEGVADGDDYTITFDAAITEELTAGLYTLVGWVEKDGERYTINESTIQIKTNLADAAAATDTRSHARITLALIEAAIESYAVRPVESLSIGGRTLTRPSLDVLTRFRARYKKLVAIEDQQDRIKAGKRPKRILARFGTVTG
jgi:hypothetical protein